MNDIIRHFPIVGAVTRCTPFGSGHINRTFLVESNSGQRYVLQEVNSHVFRDVPGLMANVTAVCAHLRRRDPDPRHSLSFHPTQEGDSFHRTADERYFRLMDFIPGGVCLDAPDSPEDLRQAGAAFGQFQRMLADFPADTLTETIPHFHDTPDRFRQLREAIAENRAGRLHTVQAEVDALLSREADADFLAGLCRTGKLPLRVTHNDTKLNNVMLDETTRQPLCVMDLDTVMPGLAAHEFGDAIRSGANTAAEDEVDVRRVRLSMEAYRAFAAGFLSACGQSLTPTEIETLPWGARLMTLECAARFMTDHLNGDVYFAIHRENHNLDRCRAQLALLADMERRWAEMNEVIRQVTAVIPQ